MEDTAVVSAAVVEPSAVNTAADSVVVASGEEAVLWVEAASAVVVTPAEVAELVVARLDDDGWLVTSWLLSAAVVTVGVVS